MRAAKVQASLRIRAVSPEPPLLAHTSSESRGTFRQKARSLAPLNGWACAVKICHDGMLEDTNSLDSAQLILIGCSRADCAEENENRRFQAFGKFVMFFVSSFFLFFICIVHVRDKFRLFTVTSTRVLSSDFFLSYLVWTLVKRTCVATLAAENPCIMKSRFYVDPGVYQL